MYPHSHPDIAGALARQRASELAADASARTFAGHDNRERRKMHTGRLTRSALVLATIVLAALVAVPAVAGAAAATVYGGSSAGDVPFALQVSTDHKRLVRALVHVEATCSDGAPLLWSGPIQFVAKLPAQLGPSDSLLASNKLPKGGSFATRGRGVGDFGDAFGEVTQSLRGKISGNKATGTLRMKIRMIDVAKSEVTATCDTGVVRFSARASRGRVFAGVTADSRPVVLELSPDRRRVTHLRVSAVAADCQPDGYSWWVGDDLTDFPVGDSSSFGDVFDTGPFNDQDGTKTSVHYEISGIVGRTTASGTYAATVADSDASGAPSAMCTVPSTHWTATS
jgi:hypothetical protein